MPGTTSFLVNPGVDLVTPVFVELELAKYLPELTQTDGSEEVGVPDKFEMAMIYWLCHMAFAEDAETSSVEKSSYYLNKFITELWANSD